MSDFDHKLTKYESDDDALLAFQKQAGLGSILSTSFGLIGGIMGARSEGKFLGQAAMVAEKHLGVDPNSNDPKLLGDLPQMDALSKEVQDSHASASELGVPQVFDQLIQGLQRNQVPMPTIALYVKTLGPLAVENYGDPRAFMEVAEAAIVRTRGVTDGQARVQEAMGTVAPLVEFAKGHPGEDVMSVAASALNGNPNSAKTLISMSAPNFNSTQQQSDPYAALHSLFTMITPNDAMRAQMSHLGLERDKMLKDQFGFYLGAAGLRANYVKLYYQNMQGIYGKLRMELGPFGRNPLVQNLLSVALKGSEAFSWYESVVHAAGLSGAPKGASAQAAIRLAQAAAASDPYAPTEISSTSTTGTSTGAAPASPTLPVPATSPTYPSEGNMNQLEQGKNPMGNAQQGGTEAQSMNLYKELLPKVQQVQQAFAPIEKEIASLQGSLTSSSGGAHLGFSPGAAMGAANIQAETIQIRSLIGTATERVNEFDNLYAQFFALNQRDPSAGYNAMINQQNQIQGYKAEVDSYRAKLKGFTETVEDVEKAMPYELELMELDPKIATAESNIQRIKKLNEVSGMNPMSGMSVGSMQWQADPETGQYGYVQTQAPMQAILGLYSEYGSILAQAKQTYTFGAQRARNAGNANLSRLFQMRVSQITAKQAEIQEKTVEYQTAPLQGKLPSGGFGNVAPRAASTEGEVLTAKGKPEDEEFEYYGDLLGKNYEKCFEEAGHGLGSQTVEEVGKKRRFKRHKD